MKADISLPAVLSLLLLAVAAGLLPGCRESALPEPSGKVVKIGVIAPLSGADKQWGENGLLGIRTLLKVRPYLANGDRPELIIEDDGNEPARTMKAMEKLVREDRVAAILVLSGSKALLPAAELADNLQTPVLVLLASHPEIAASPWVYQLIFDDEMQAKVAALYVRDELLHDFVAVFRQPDDPHSKVLADVFAREFKETGGGVEVVDLAGVRENYDEIASTLKAGGVDFLYLPLSAGVVLEIKKAVGAAGWNPGIMVSDGVLSQILLQYEDQLHLADGMLATELYSIDLRDSHYGKAVVRTFKRNFEAPSTTFTAVGCEGMAILMSAMEACTPVDDADCLQRTLRRKKGFDGLISRMHFQPDGKIERPIYINSISGEHLVPVVKVY